MINTGVGVRPRRGRGVVAAVVGLIALASGGGARGGVPFEVFSDWSFYNRSGWQALQRGKLDRAEQAFRMAIERMRPYQATESVPLARSYADLARVLHAKGRHDEAEPLARWAVAVRETAPGESSQALSQSLELLAEIDVSRGRDAEAEPIITRVIAIREKALGASHPDLIPAFEVLAEVYARQGKIAQAEPAYRRALSLRELNSVESLKKAEQQEQSAATLRVFMVADGTSTVGSQLMVGRAIQVQRLESDAASLRESSSESLSAADTTERYSAALRRAGRVEEADDVQARAKAIRDAVETRAAAKR